MRTETPIRTIPFTRGWMVIEHVDEFEQPLGLDTSDDKPKGGILEWTEKARAIFPDHKSARDAICRTDHYRQAFRTNHPERRFCKIVPVKMVEVTQ